MTTHRWVKNAKGEYVVEAFPRKGVATKPITEPFENLYPEAQDISEDEFYNYYEKQEEVIDSLIYEYQNHINEPNYRQEWKVIPAARVKKIWNDYAKMGFVRDEKGINQMAEQVIENVQKIAGNNILTGHEAYNPAEYAGERLQKKLEDEYFEKLDDFFTDDNGAWRISDYSIAKLQANANQLMIAKTAEEKLLIMDRMFNIFHQRSDLSSWFIEGGQKTFTELAG